MRYLIVTLALCAFINLSAQGTTGSIVGKLTDTDNNNEPLAFANVLIKGTTKGTTSDFDGLYEIANLEPGTYTVSFSYLGYESVDIPNVNVVAGKVTTINVPMSASEGVSLDEVVVTTVARKDSELALLLDQKKATEIKTSIGAQELSRKGVSDVATAVTKTTGISKQEGSSDIFVRGLGDRYNITTLNGLPLPTNDASKKNINLDIFSTDIVESIGIEKTYNPSNYGDFAGAKVDIVSRNYNGDGFVQVGVGSGINTESVGVDNFYLNDGPNQSGFYTKDYPANPLTGYNFTTSWDREKISTPINTSVSLMGGDSYNLGETTRLNFFAMGSFDNNYKYTEGISRNGVNVAAVPDGDLNFTNYAYNTNTTLMGNLGLRAGSSNLKYNVFYLNSSSQQQLEYTGIIDKDDTAATGGGFIQRSVFDRTTLLINQLLGDHNLGDAFEIHWGASYNMSENIVPNRRQITLLPDTNNNPDGPKSFRLISSSSDNNRYYHTLDEDELAANFATTYKFNKNEDDDTFGGKLTLGYNGRFKKVDFSATQFNFRIAQRGSDGSLIRQPYVDPYNADAYFNQSIMDQGYFRIETFRGSANVANALDPQTYGGNQDIHAGYLSLEYALSPKLTMLAGIRGEQIDQFIEWSTSLDPEGDSSDFKSTEWLPSLSLKYALNDKQNLKFAASKTYTLPQYKERAFFLFQEVNQDYQGNPSLYASTDYNADLKWELFPKSDEIVSLGVFGKYIENPINTAVINSASNDISYVNSGDSATAWGAELEVRKNIFDHDDDSGDNILNTNLSIGFNASYLNTDQKLDGDKVLEETTANGVPLSVTFTNENDKISGASDLLLNGDLSFSKDFSKDRNILATLAYNYFSDRIYALGVLGKGNLVDKGLGTLDLIVKSKLSQHIGLGLSAKNILNPTVERFQDIQDITVLSYKKGSEFKLSLSYSF